jgi:protein-disulfide isomerase
MKLKDTLFLVFMGILAGCALIFTGFIVKSRFFPATTPAHFQHGLVRSTRHVKNWQKLKLTGQRAGPVDAPVQIVEFFDYQCPYCKRAQPAVKAIRKKYPKKVSVIHVNNPLQMHQHAFGAAIAAECARRIKPPIFMAYHDSLFSHQKRLGQPGFYQAMAAEVGISDSLAFARCVRMQKTAGIINTGEALAQKLHIRGIPTFIINGKFVTGVLNKHQMGELVQDALAKVKQ